MIKFCKNCQCETERTKKGACKPCGKKRHAAWKALNKEKLKEYHAAWRSKNKDKVNAYSAAYNKKRPVRIKTRVDKPPRFTGEPTQEYLKSIFCYDPETGLLTFIRQRGGYPAGSVAGTKKQNGYIVVSVNRKLYRAHRLAWLYVHGVMPTGDIDHINGVRDDNRIANLRLATRTQNNANAKVASHNTSGYKGVSYDKERNRYQAAIKHNGVRIALGRYLTAEDAHEAYCAAAIELKGEFARFQ